MCLELREFDMDLGNSGVFRATAEKLKNRSVILYFLRKALLDKEIYK
jgi:hypothetical protein